MMDTAVSEQTGPLATCHYGALAVWLLGTATASDFDLLKLKQSEPGDLGLFRSWFYQRPGCAAGVSHLSKRDGGGMSPAAPWGLVDEPGASGRSPWKATTALAAAAAALTPLSGCFHTLLHLVRHQELRAGGLLRGHERSWGDRGRWGGVPSLSVQPLWSQVNELGFLLRAFLLMEFSSQN